MQRSCNQIHDVIFTEKLSKSCRCEVSDISNSRGLFDSLLFGLIFDQPAELVLCDLLEDLIFLLGLLLCQLHFSHILTVDKDKL